MTLRARIGVVVWVAVVAAICALRIQVVLGSTALAVAAVLVYLVTSRGRPIRSRFFFSILIFVFSVMVPRVFFWITWDPIGDSYDNGWGRFPLADAVDRVATVGNGRGTEAVIRRTRGALLVSDDPIPYYVFVHRAGVDDTASNLVFRYESTDAGWNTPPSVKWIDGHTLQITVQYGDLSVVTAQRGNIDGIAVNYRLPKVRTETAWWQRPLF